MARALTGPKRRQPWEARLWGKVRFRDDGCWVPDLYALPNGYCLMRIGYGTDRRTEYTHRLAYVATFGPIPAGMEIDHRCHSESDCCDGPKCPHRACMNPWHLEAVTHKVNMERGSPARKTHCKRGHEFTEENIRWLRTPSGSWCRGCRECARLRKAEVLA